MKRLMSVILAVVMCTSLITLSGCGKEDPNADPLLSETKEALVSEIHALESERDGYWDRIIKLEDLLKGVQGDDVETASISEFGDGTGRLTLHSVDGLITLPAPFEYPFSTQTYNSSAIEIFDNITIKPSSNWVVKLTGTEIDVEHTASEISGVIKVGHIEKDGLGIKPDGLNTYISDFFTNMPPETIQYNKIFLGSTWKGMDASAHTFIDEADAQLRCGMIAMGDTSIVYMFVYKGEKDASKDELIVTLLQTMVVKSQILKVE